MKSTKDILRKLFNENRAEWPQEDFKQLFIEPTYLGKLESIRPCVIVGGRGTGKTTSLKSLIYDTTLERLRSHDLDIKDQEYFGVLIRMNKNRVKAFDGGDVSIEQWGKIFAHYINLLVCKELTLMSIWLEKMTKRVLAVNDIRFISKDLGLGGDTKSLEDLLFEIKNGLSDIQIYVNNPVSQQPPSLSMAESPLRIFSEALNESGLTNGKVIFCCIDEYENLSDYQQAIINTYIKHAEPPLSYKIGVRKNGFRNRQTLNKQDMLVVPDDYDEIQIIDEDFEYFATAVAEKRLAFANKKGVNVPLKLRNFLCEYSFSEELEKLGVNNISNKVLEELNKPETTVLFDFFKNKPSSEIYFLAYWQARTGDKISDIAQNWIENAKVWKGRLDNHGYASLFWVSRGKGQRIKKYYCGERVLLTLAGGNIRYFLELINSAINEEIGSLHEETSSQIVLSQESQTIAARHVGLNRLNQLEGLADDGVKLKRLVLAIGKVFFEYARTPENNAPEINSFIISGGQESKTEVIKLLKEGVGHLAFEVEPRTKATSSYEMKDDEYRLHWIYTGFFEISHRKKRRVTFKAEDLLDVLDSKPSQAISKLLDKNKKTLIKKVNTPLIEEIDFKELPEQMALFSSFYGQE